MIFRPSSAPEEREAKKGAIRKERAKRLRVTYLLQPLGKKAAQKIINIEMPREHSP